eukprot:1112491-Karenia_brevis.AAC.1
MSLSSKQSSMIGTSRTVECVTAQLRGRGLADEYPPVNLEAYAFHKFPRCSYAEPTLNATQWAAMAAIDSNAGAISCGNHVCRDSVCRKGRL